MEVFAPVDEGRSVWSEGVEQLGRIPLEPRSGSAFSWQMDVFDEIATRLVDALERRRAA